MDTCESSERSALCEKSDRYMELHAFERMAQAVDRPLTAMQDSDVRSYRETSVFPDVTPPGMSYVPYQQWGGIYDASEGIGRGTMFPVLDFPFDPKGGGCR